MITVTEAALAEAKLILIKRNNPGEYIRFGIKGSGCSGFAYVVKFDVKPFNEDKDENLISIGETPILITDKKSILYLEGCVIDYKKTLMEHGFDIKNPNEKSKCGCGKSFSVSV